MLAATLGLTAAAPSPAPQDERAAILAVVTQVFDGMRARDGERVRKAFHPSAQLVTTSVRDGGPEISVVTLEAFITAVTRPRPEMADERTRNEVVHIDGHLASVWAEYALYRGRTFSHCGIDAFHLAKDSEGWKIVALGDTRRTTGCDDWPREPPDDGPRGPRE
jgi:hypothetical protein